MSKLSKIIFLIVISAFAFMLVYPAITYSNQATDIIFFNSNKADSILLVNKDVTILIDTGLRADKNQLADSLKTLGIRNIDYLILTHPDKDHIGGASHIIDTFNVKNIIQGTYIKGSKAEARIKNSLKLKSTNNIILKKDMQIELENLSIEIMVPSKKNYEKSNDNSLITLVKDRNLNYLFAADAEKDLLAEIIEKDLPEIDLYKVAHHGKFNKNSKVMIDKIKPKISVVTNNSADEKVVKALKAVGSEIYYAYDKPVRITSDGKNLKVR